jgi:hypothetical protein
MLKAIAHLKVDALGIPSRVYDSDLEDGYRPELAKFVPWHAHLLEKHVEVSIMTSTVPKLESEGRIIEKRTWAQFKRVWDLLESELPNSEESILDYFCICYVIFAYAYERKPDGSHWAQFLRRITRYRYLVTHKLATADHTTEEQRWRDLSQYWMHKALQSQPNVGSGYTWWTIEARSDLEELFGYLNAINAPKPCPAALECLRAFLSVNKRRSSTAKADQAFIRIYREFYLKLVEREQCDTPQHILAWMEEFWKLLKTDVCSEAWFNTG